MRWLVGVIGAIVVLGMSPGADAETTLSRATVNGNFRATTHATSKAGAAVGSSTQATDQVPLYLGRVEGTMNLDGVDISGCTSHEHRSFSASFHDEYSEGPINLERGGAIATGYDVAGSGSAVINPCPASADPGCSYDLQAIAPTKLESGQVLFSKRGDDPTGIQVEVTTSDWITGPGCGATGGDQRPGIVLGEGRIPISALGADTITVSLTHHESDFTTTYDASGTLTLQRVQDDVRAEEFVIGPATLRQTVNLHARPVPPTATVQSYQWEMRRSRMPTWTTLATTTNPAYSFKAQLAGHFKLRTVLNGVRRTPESVPRQVVTPQVGLEVRFPTRDQIAANQGVDNFTLYAWGRTLVLATPQQRQELGFWIALDTCTGRFHKTQTIHGPPVPSDKTGSVNLGLRPADTHPPGVTGCGIYWVATFHTHTPTTYRTPHTSTRKVGPSAQDKTNATNNRKMPGFVYDYIAHPPGSGKIPFGYPKHSPAQIYRYGVLRRPTPQ